MSLKPELKTLDGVDEAIKQYYKEEDGVFKLDVELPKKKEEAKSIKKVEELSRTVANLEKQLATEKEKGKGEASLDPTLLEFMKNLQKQTQDKEDQKLMKEDVNAFIEKKIGATQNRELNDTKAMLKQKEESESTLRNQLNDYKLQQEIVNAVNEVGGLQKGALNFVIDSAKNKFQFDENGELSSTEKDDDDLYLTPLKFVQNMKAENSYLFQDSTGTGATGSNAQVNSQRKVFTHGNLTAEEQQLVVEGKADWTVE